MYDYSGQWTGKFEGTNHGGVFLELRQTDRIVVGTAAMTELEYGPYHYSVLGSAGETLSLDLKPGWQPGWLTLGNIRAIGKLDASSSELSGTWESSIGTRGIFRVRRRELDTPAANAPQPHSVFIVHGRDESSKEAVARFLERFGVDVIILQEQINAGKTIIEKFETFASKAAFAVILMTPDDYGFLVGDDERRMRRPRQNVLLEFGYFAALLGRSKILVLVKGDLELPSDILGLVYEPMDSGGGWQIRLARELKAAGFAIDLNLLAD